MAERVALITGSSRGIGLVTAAEFLKHGDRAVIFCRHQDHVEQAAKELLLLSDAEHLLPLVGDVRNSQNVRRIVKAALDRFGRIDVLINNAGMAVWKPVEETTEEEWDNVLDTNLKGSFLFIRQVVPIMKKQGNGIIINISSGLGIKGQAKYSPYCSSKFGLVGLTQVIADELSGTPILCYAVLPGGVATKLHLDIHPWEDPSTMMSPEQVAEKIFKLAEGKKKTGYLMEVRR